MIGHNGGAAPLHEHTENCNNATGDTQPLAATSDSAFEGAQSARLSDVSRQAGPPNDGRNKGQGGLARGWGPLETVSPRHG